MITRTKKSLELTLVALAYKTDRGQITTAPSTEANEAVDLEETGAPYLVTGVTL